MSGMNGRQLLILWLVAVIAIVFFLLPPVGRPAEYGYVFAEGYRWFSSIESRQVVDYNRLHIQYLILGFIGLIGVLSSRERGVVHSRAMRSWGVGVLIVGIALAVVWFISAPVRWKGGDFSGWTINTGSQKLSDGGLEIVEWIHYATVFGSLLFIALGIGLIARAKKR